MSPDQLSRIYDLLGWPDNPYTGSGRARYENALGEARRIIGHQWLQEVVGSRRTVRILDVCGGSGIAGAAFARVLREMDLEPEVIVVDLRREALERARRFVREEAGTEPRALAVDATRMHGLGASADIALLWGLSTTHFSPWDLVRLYSGIAANLVSDGVLVVEEADRHSTIFLQNRYQLVLPENIGDGRMVLSVHKGRDPISGYITRAIVDIASGKTAEAKVYFWDIASSAAIAWAFFRDVCFMQGGSMYHGYVIARWPRKTLRPEDLGSSEPEMLKATTRGGGT